MGQPHFEILDIPDVVVTLRTVSAIDYPCLFVVDDDRSGLLLVVQVLFWVIQGQGQDQGLVSMIVAVMMRRVGRSIRYLLPNTCG